MRIIRSSDRTDPSCQALLQSTPIVAAVGFFDGVHRGHAYLLDLLKQEAARRHGRSLVITFPTHPRKVLQPQQTPPLLTTAEEKARLLEALGIDLCAMIDFTPNFARQTSQAFMREYLRQWFHTDCLLVGYDHHFGSDADASFERYCEEGRALDIDVVKADEWTEASSHASSSAIRRLLQSGDVDEATRLLGHAYTLSGTIGDGRGIGHTLGFPTANLRTDNPDKLLPKDGAYAVWAAVDGHDYAAMTYIGRRPTFDDSLERTIETHLIGQRLELYGKPMTLRFTARLRDEQTFASTDALVSQLERDVAHAKTLLL